ncbi:cytosolic sulfotransferase 5-like [Cannabis sativa]|uniref:cytosolic sulfotransferase 5-like n=1 Tax=Cannabis sativa TaxID=3483 RepID=UPI0029C9B533|nr:cytosolic sulfotransferase 5-like [Cannabis sativa]
MAKETTKYFSNEENNNGDESLESIISQLPKANSWSKYGITLYQNCWFPSNMIPNIISFQKQFKAEDEDIIVASFPKSGTTWLISLLFSILNRNQHYDQHPLLSTNPHDLVPSLEFSIYSNPNFYDLSTMSNPRLVSTHMPYASLSDSIKSSSKSRIVYISRNPLDVIVSYWYYVNDLSDHSHTNKCTIEDFVDMFCSGENSFGPYWDHILGFWKASLDNPKKVLFLKYEEMKKDSIGQAKRIAKFIGLPFTQEEENNNGVMDQILEMCSFNKLKDLNVNKQGKFKPHLDNKFFFRKGETGDWINHLSPSMVERVNKITQEKLNGSGLSFIENMA